MSRPAGRGRLVRRVAGAPVVAVRVALAGGARVEPIPGAALIAGRGLAEGTRRRDYRRLAETAERRGMTLSGYGAFESLGVSVDALAGDWERALELAAELIFEPVFPEPRLDLLRRQAAAELEAEADEADELTARAFLDLLYAPHPKGRPLQGDAASLARIDAEAARTVHRRALAAGGCVAVAGEIDEARVAARVDELFSALPPARPAEELAPPPAARAARREIETRARDQAHLLIGQLTVPRTDPDAPALELAAVILGSGSGLSGRIPNRVRDQEGLAYHASAHALAGAGVDAGRLVAYLGTAPSRLAQAERAIAEELARLVDEGLGEEEVGQARSFLLGREPFGRETARQWAELAAYGSILGLPLEDPAWSEARIRTPDRSAIESALRRHLDPRRLGVAVGRPGG